MQPQLTVVEAFPFTWTDHVLEETMTWTVYVDPLPFERAFAAAGADG
jgi:hypothetical protein